MNKIEFLDNLRAALSSELPANEIESNLQFYNEYITTNMSKKSEEEILQELGDPRLIAKTLIETYQISHGAPYSGHRSEYRDNQTDDNNEYSDASNKRENKAYFDFNSSLKWYQKLILCIVVIVLFVVIFFVGGIVINVFINFGIPILIIYFGYKIISKSIHRR